MSGNTIGRLYCVTSFGESHGPAIGCVVDGCPPGMALSAADIQVQLDRRKPGTSRHVTQRRESDTVEILSGVFEGKTTGTPIALLIRNEDQRSKDYGNIAETFRPGHADYTYWQKYGIRDFRGGGRQSARETAVRVAAAAIARKWLSERYGVRIRGYMSQLGSIPIAFKAWDCVDGNPFFSPDPDIVPDLEAFMDRLRKSGDSCGARITAVAENVPVGWGEPVYGKLDADIAHAMMGINAVKGVEIGAGFAAVGQNGTEHSDEMTPDGFLSNHAGGILGGISTGQDIVVNIAVKPTSSIRLPRRSIDKQGKPTIVETTGRHDPCVGIRATPIAEAMLALVLMDHALRHRAQNADVHVPTPRIAARARPARPRGRPPDRPTTRSLTKPEDVGALDRLYEVGRQEWRPVGAPSFIAATLLVAAVAYLANSGQRWVHVLDSANLAFHEAGHPIFGLLLGDRVTVYGGTFGQLVFPVVATASFWWRREALSFALCAAWFFENLWNIARYMADARAQVLPLVGSGEHDWTEIFSRWGVLHRDTAIAGLVWLVGCLGILAAWLWLLRRWMHDRETA